MWSVLPLMQPQKERTHLVPASSPAGLPNTIESQGSWAPGARQTVTLLAMKADRHGAVCSQEQCLMVPLNFTYKKTSKIRLRRVLGWWPLSLTSSTWPRKHGLHVHETGPVFHSTLSRTGLGFVWEMFKGWRKENKPAAWAPSLCLGLVTMYTASEDGS